jgi:hypothetical protein
VNVLCSPPWVERELRLNCELAETEEGLLIFHFLFGGGPGGGDRVFC